MRNTITAATVAAMLAGCAPSPDAIAPAPMTGAYDGTSCAKVAAMLQQERATLADLTKKQEDARRTDAVTGILFGVIIMAAASHSYEGEIAASKGKVQALEARAAACG